jgi:hypothetical protein
VILAGVAVAQVPERVTDPQMTRQFDRLSDAFRKAQADAEGDEIGPLRKSLTHLHNVWGDTYLKYRHWVTRDSQWTSTFNSIQASLINATNAVSPQNNMSAAKNHIDNAAAAFESLRDRNGVPDVRASLENVAKSLIDLATVAKGLYGKTLTESDLQSIQNAFAYAADAWQVFSQAAVDVNVLGLDQDALNRLNRLVTANNSTLEYIENGLGNPQVQTFLVNVQNAQQQVEEISDQLPEIESAPSGDGTIVYTPPTTNTGETKKRWRPRLFRR